MRIQVMMGGALLALCVVSAGCDEQLSDLTGPTPSLEPTFSSIQRDIFNTTDASGRTACTQCHSDAGGRTPTGGLNLREGVAYANLVGVATRGKPGTIRVVAGDPESSYLIHKLEGRADIAGVRMPRGNGPFLTPGQMLVIKRWIELGARNN
ncbi:MAG: hypothetical protein HY824_11195 [Acidobacteria bacterium]|nr:hypothetical protein [Acidobacteriota bacterium]